MTRIASAGIELANDAMNNAIFFLSTNCFVCRAQGYWIILDVMKDKYLCVAHDDLASIGDLLHGWQERRLDTKPCQPDPNGTELVQALTSSGIITSRSEQGKPFVESDFPAAQHSIDGSHFDASAKVSLQCVAHFFLACARTDWHLRRTALFRALTGIAKRRGAPSIAIYDAGGLLSLIAAFKALRPFYPRRYLCLFDSLALFEFLASYRVFPHVVFGVIADPFEAHCWLQVGSTILNDDLERVVKFKPILSL